MFFRTKLVSIFVATVLIWMGLAYLLFIRPLLSGCNEQMRGQVMSTARAAAVMHRADELAVRALVEDLASQPRLRQAMLCESSADPTECEQQRHRQVLAALEDWYRQFNANFEQNRTRAIGARELTYGFPQAPTLMMVADQEGTVVARYIGDVSDWYGPGVLNLRSSEVSTFAVVSDALSENTAQHDIIPWQEAAGGRPTRTLTLVGAAPVHHWVTSGGSALPVGVALLGFPINQPMAEDKQTALGDISLAYTLGDELVASSATARDLQRCSDGSFHDTSGATVAQALSAFLQRSSLNTVYTYRCQGQSYLVMRLGFAPDRAGTDPAGYLLVGSLSPGLSRLHNLVVGLPLIGLLLLVLGLVALVWVVNRFLAPLERIDQGIQQVIAGNRDFVWQVDSRNPYHAEMAQALNVMNAILQDKPLPDEEQRLDDKEWEDLLQFAEVEITGQFLSLDLAEARRAERRRKAEEAAKEPLDKFHRRLFEEYLQARKEAGSPEKKITFDGFVEQIRKKAEVYKETHDCREVRFEVVTKGDTVVLKPIPIK